MRQICEFLGYHYSDHVIDRITQHTTFRCMKKNPMTNPDTFNVQREAEKHISFMRKGKGSSTPNLSEHENKTE